MNWKQKSEPSPNIHLFGALPSPWEFAVSSPAQPQPKNNLILKVVVIYQCLDIYIYEASKGDSPHVNTLNEGEILYYEIICLKLYNFHIGKIPFESSKAFV